MASPGSSMDWTPTWPATPNANPLRRSASQAFGFADEDSTLNIIEEDPSCAMPGAWPTPRRILAYYKAPHKRRCTRHVTDLLATPPAPRTRVINFLRRLRSPLRRVAHSPFTQRYFNALFEPPQPQSNPLKSESSPTQAHSQDAYEHGADITSSQALAQVADAGAQRHQEIVDRFRTEGRSHRHKDPFYLEGYSRDLEYKSPFDYDEPSNVVQSKSPFRFDTLSPNSMRKSLVGFVEPFQISESRSRIDYDDSSHNLRSKSSFDFYEPLHEPLTKNPFDYDELSHDLLSKSPVDFDKPSAHPESRFPSYYDESEDVQSRRPSLSSDISSSLELEHLPELEYLPEVADPFVVEVQPEAKEPSILITDESVPDDDFHFVQPEATEPSILITEESVPDDDCIPAPRLYFPKLHIPPSPNAPVLLPPSGSPESRIKRQTRYQIRLAEEEAAAKKLQEELSRKPFLPLTAEQEQVVTDALSKGYKTFTTADLRRVVPTGRGGGSSGWLNDEVINAYLDLIVTHGNKNFAGTGNKKFHAFNSFFFTNLHTKGYASVARWAKKAKIDDPKVLLEMEAIYAPVNSGNHWTLMVIRPSSRSVHYYDSMSGAGANAMRAARTWLAGQLGQHYHESDWTFTASAESPQQNNFSDCGVFTITTAKLLTLGVSPMAYGPADIPGVRRKIIAELIAGGLF